MANNGVGIRGLILGTGIGGLVVFGVTTLYTDVYKQPRINFDLHNTVQYRGSGELISPSNLIDTLTISNTGQVSATHLRLTFNLGPGNLLAYDKGGLATGGDFYGGFYDENTTIVKEGKTMSHSFPGLPPEQGLT